MDTERLESGIAKRLEGKLPTLRERAEFFAQQQVQKMMNDGEVFHLSEDEQRMIEAYRAFVTRSQPGKVFGWRTPEGPAKIVTPEMTSILRDPQEVHVGETTAI